MKKYAVLFAALVSVEAYADTANLSWVNPTQYTDGTALDQAIAQTNIRCTALVIGGSRNPCNLTDQRTTGTTSTFLWTYTISFSLSGNICFAVQTQLADASLSDWSNEGCKPFIATKKGKSPVLAVK